jgi:hypothetical protein
MGSTGFTLAGNGELHSLSELGAKVKVSGKEARETRTRLRGPR